MRNTYQLLLMLALSALALSAQAQTGAVGIGTPSPDPTAVLDVSATTKGMLAPRLTSAQRQAIATPANGLLVYQTDGTQPGLWYYDTGVWKYLSGAAPGQGPAVGGTTVSTLTVPAVGSGSTDFPYLGTYSDSRVFLLYTAAELTAAGLQAGPIQSMAFNVLTKNSTQPYHNFTIKLQATTATAAANATTGGTVVFSGDVTTTVGWNTHRFQTPFVWDGASNLIVEACFDNSAATQSDFTATRTSPVATTSWIVVNNPSASFVGCALTTSSNMSTRNDAPLVRFGQNQSSAGGYQLPATAGNVGDVLVQQANGGVQFTNPILVGTATTSVIVPTAAAGTLTLAAPTTPTVLLADNGASVNNSPVRLNSGTGTNGQLLTVNNLDAAPVRITTYNGATTPAVLSDGNLLSGFAARYLYVGSGTTGGWRRVN